ncbi:MAG: hypothetical protein P8009_05715 [Gammaproteobacteria bacterium]
MKSLVRSEQARLWWLLAGVAAMFAFSMGTHPFIPSMEPRFGEVIREMLARGEYLIPIKNGVPYVEYPPLYYWLSLAGHVVGLPETVAIRLPAAVAFLLWIFWLARLQRTVRPAWRVYWLPLVGAALPGVLYHFFVAQSDSVLILGTLIGLTGYWRLRQRIEQGQGGGFPWELWLGVTLATMAKGPVGLMVTLPVIALDIMLEPIAAAQGSWWRAIWRRAGHTAWVRGLALVLLFNTPWYIAVGLRDGWELVRAMVVYQNFTRFLVGFDHLQPWWYYGKTIWYDMLPAAFALPFALFLGWRRRRERRWRLPLVWILWTVVFFSLSASKQGKYILTAAPSVALLGLLTLETLCSARWWKRLRIAAQIWALLVLVSFSVTAVFVLPRYSNEIGGVGGLEKIRRIVAQEPGRVVSYAWPRAEELYVLGAPMPCVRSARQLYRWLHEGKLRPGDYLLVAQRHLPRPGQTPGSTTLSPAPAAPYFKQIAQVDFNGVLYAYRVLPGASEAPLPKTPEPPPHHWWEQFDTD